MAGRAAYQPASELFLEQVQGDSLSCCPADGNSADLESVDTPSSDNSDNRAWHLAQAVARAPTGRDNAVHLSKPTLTPQLCLPRFLCRGTKSPVFGAWSQCILSGLWWKLLSLQPLHLIACLPRLSCFRNVRQADLPGHGKAGSYCCPKEGPGCLGSHLLFCRPRETQLLPGPCCRGLPL